MRGHQDDRGFTLIELMVVVLIIAILLAIGIPSFLGARNRASDRAAQSNLRNAHTSELVWFADNTSTFTADLVELRKIDPSLDWTDQPADLTGRRGSVYVVVGSLAGRSTVVVGSQSRPGTCFWLRAVADAEEPRFAKNNCAVPADGAFGDSWD